MADESKSELEQTSNEKVESFQESSTRYMLFYSLYQASINLDINTCCSQDSYEVFRSNSDVSISLSIEDQDDIFLNNYNFFISDTPIYELHSQDSELDHMIDTIKENRHLFGLNEIMVYMTLFDDYYRQRTSGTQATASVNKCFQVYSRAGQESSKSIESNSNYCSTCTVSTSPYTNSRRSERMRFSEVYFFGRAKDTKQKGMGQKESKTSLRKSGQCSSGAIRTSCGSNTPSRNRQNRGASTGTCTTKSVSIKDDKPQKPCPAVAASKGEMMATISHIKIGPKETCPTFGKEPCIGPRCIVASSGEEQGPVKVTTVNNPRRGVFELVIRRMTGAPLAKNELMLEWTPPPSRPIPCPSPCPVTCWPPSPCPPSKCKLIVCRPSPCKPKCCKKKPCGQPCRKCSKPSCCKPGPPPRCCPPSPCKSPCSPITCKKPCFSCCRSSPCLRPCPIGHRRPRRTRSQPRIKSHTKRASPCCNRSKTCPVVRCRSVPGPCIGCCGLPPFCPPRKCCSVLPCKPPKCSRSACSTCCS